VALRTPALWMGNPAVQHTAQNDRLFRAGLLRPETGQTAANRPLTAASGVLVGPAGTMGEVALLSNTQFTVNPARWLIYSSASALGGSYEVTNDAVETLAITAQDASQYRRSYFGVWVVDSFVAGSGDDLPHRGLIDGALATSAVAAALPAAGAQPANFLALGEFLIPPVGQAVTYTPYDLRTGLRGGVLPTTATDTRNGSYLWQLRRHPTLGLQEWNGTAWVAVKSTSADWALVPLTAPMTQNNLAADGVVPGPGTPGWQYRREGDRVFFRGVAYSNAAIGNDGILAILPAEVRPPVIAFLPTWWELGAGKGTTRLDVSPNGNIYAKTGLSVNTYLFTDGLSYPLS
jgi:hypothetical protein